jgi:hypothetical protein
MRIVPLPRPLAGSALALVLAILPTASALPAEGRFDALRWRHIGPVGNRVSAVYGIPGDPNTYYFGAASGGVFKTTDGGVHWTPVFDDQPVLSVGAIAVSTADANVVWVGTGEAHIRSNVSLGNGVYRSTDAGGTWTQTGLEATGRISRIATHPTDPDTAWVAALGHLYAPQEERGIFRTTDGGATWDRVLFVDERTGASEIVISPANPKLLFAGMWQMRMWTWGRESGGPGSGIFRSRDGGDSWERLEGNGLPERPWGKVALSLTAADPRRIYALIETSSNEEFAPLDEQDGVLWRSDDGGDTWELTSRDHTLMQRPHYYTRVVAAPDDADEAHFLATRHTTTTDGGITTFLNNSGGDHHDMWIAPGQPDRMIVGHDGGVSISTNRGETWQRPRLPIAQMYHVYTDNRIPYRVMGNRQDGPSSRGPSNSLTGGGIPIGAWAPVGGCESGFAIPDPSDPGVIWSGCFEGILERYEDRTGQARNVSVWPDNPEGWAAGELRDRFQWTFPIHISPHDSNRVYAGSQRVHVTANAGQSWEVISPDLTTDDPDLQLKTGGLTYDDVSPTYAAVLFSLAESPHTAGVLWAGSNDGKIHVSRNAGDSWEDVSGNLPGLPPLGTYSNIEPSRHAAGAAYATVDLHQIGDTNTYAYKTEDFGASWRRLGQDIPQHTHSYAHTIREDPVRPGLLFLGTENAVYVSFDDGETFESLQSNLPHAPVHWLTIQERFSDLVAATYGRGFWILDDITPLRQLTAAAEAAPAQLFAPREAWRFRMRPTPMSQPEDPGAGENPPYGATIHYRLGEDQPDVSIEIADSGGDVVRTVAGDGDAGLHRVVWNLRNEPTRRPRLRTPPLDSPHQVLPARGFRLLTESRPVATLLAPGNYTVRLNAGGESLEQPLTVHADPEAPHAGAEIPGQVNTLLRIQEMVDKVGAMIEEIEWLRKQTAERRALGGALASTVEVAAGEYDSALMELEARFFELRLTGGNAGQDTLRWPRRLHAKLSSLHGYIGGSDHRPTDQHLEVLALYEQELAETRAMLNQLTGDELDAFNDQLSGAGLPPVVPTESGEER